MVLRLAAVHIKSLRVLVHLGSLGFLLWLGYALPAGLLGGDPVQGLTHYLGKGALNLLLITLLVPVHYWWSVKSGWQEPLIYLLLACALLWPRREKLLRPWRQRQRQKLKEA